ncbi:MAG: hypothetical protein OEV66_10220 [Spirochaetia bacterium]|nr:hypothetical protein [Spirochaetia bacterium]
MFHKEKEDILKVGLQISKSVTTDDTGLRHRGANGYCTHIGNEFFAYFKSSNSKSRINFLEIPSEFCRLPQGREFRNKSEWEKYLKILEIQDDYSVRKATEGALLGVIMKKIKTGLTIFLQ